MEYRCTYEGCGLMFSRGDNLHRHKKIHTKEKTFSCSVCSKTFLRKTNSQYHEKHCKQLVRKLLVGGADTESKSQQDDMKDIKSVIIGKKRSFISVEDFNTEALKKQEYIEEEEQFDKFEFESFITGYYHYRRIWTPKIDEELTTTPELDNQYDKFAVSVLKNNDTIVGHVPRQISKEITTILKSGGSVKAKVIAKPLNTKVWGIRVPCIYNVIGKRKHLQDIKDNIITIF